jgi:hypothetical protein
VKDPLQLLLVWGFKKYGNKKPQENQNGKSAA